MENIFLDYYDPYGGLCNQLYLISNHLHQALNENKMIFIHKFNTDVFKKERVPAEEIFDLNKTNENIKRITGK